MIVSASRRTDLPAFYADWFFRRLDAGYALVRHPMNARRVTRVSLLPEDVDCFVFWSKNPAPLAERLGELDRRGFASYFQFTLNPYGPDLEPNLPDKASLAAAFRTLSARIGRARVLWRYDPIVLDERRTVSWHTEAFARLCDALAPYTERVTFSFADLYARLPKGLLRAPAPEEAEALGAFIGRCAREHGLTAFTCCETADFTRYGVGKAVCIDRSLAERLCGHPVKAGPDRGQRPGCGCCASVDLGAYGTCPHLCRYCYANRGGRAAAEAALRHDPSAELLAGARRGDEIVTSKP